MVMNAAIDAGEEIIMLTDNKVEVTDNYVRLRQKAPSAFVDGSFRIASIPDKDGYIKAIMGKLKCTSKGQEESTDVQSYLFDKDLWTVKSATKWVDDRKSTKNAGVTEQFVTIALNVKPVTRKDKIGGKEYIVAPAVILLEGVHNGNHGPLLYPWEEIAQTPTAWNAKPVVVYHPKDGAETACTPEFLTSNGVGMILNAKASGRKLKVETWFDADALSRVDKRVESAVNRQRVMEVSTGLYMNVEWTEGDWNGEHYVGIARNYRPDHLAVLPDQIGACSVADGAGLMKMNASQARHTLPKSWTDDFFPFMRAVGIDVDVLSMNELSYNDVREQLRALLKNAWVVEVYEDHFVYEIESGKLFDQKYKIEKDVASLVGAATEVVRIVQYKSKAGVIIGNAVKELTNMTKKEAIDALVANGQCKETDRSELEKLADVTLISLAEAFSKAKQADVPQAPQSSATAVATVNDSADVKSIAKKTLEECLNEMAPEVARQARYGISAYNAQVGAVIAKIVACPQNKFTAAQLKEKDLEELQQIESLIAAPVSTNNYVGQGDGPNITAVNGKVLEIPTYNFEQTLAAK